VAASAVVLLARLGQLAAIGDRLRHASTALILLAVLFEALSFAG
jgi:hypothetical protein